MLQNPDPVRVVYSDQIHLKQKDNQHFSGKQYQLQLNALKINSIDKCYVTYKIPIPGQRQI